MGPMHRQSEVARLIQQRPLKFAVRLLDQVISSGNCVYSVNATRKSSLATRARR